mmetsp:Transcript_32923/g.77575  ORF Transcript_32923/g.77575 Transcript_32923/m.77575 type:complete len:222 (-) Transcript_32923:62-727(-)
MCRELLPRRRRLHSFPAFPVGELRLALNLSLRAAPQLRSEGEHPRLERGQEATNQPQQAVLRREARRLDDGGTQRDDHHTECCLPFHGRERYLPRRRAAAPRQTLQHAGGSGAEVVLRGRFREPRGKAASVLRSPARPHKADDLWHEERWRLDLLCDLLVGGFHLLLVLGQPGCEGAREKVDDMDGRQSGEERESREGRQSGDSGEEGRAGEQGQEGLILR